jgi:hypothetical protein
VPAGQNSWGEELKMRGVISRRLPAAAGILMSAATIGLMSASAVQAAPVTNFTWSGSDPLTGWSAGDNWAGGSDPGSAASIGTLSFPDLGSACDNGTSAGTCYGSTDDEGPLTAQELTIDNSTQYNIAPNSAATDTLTLDGNGSGIGLDATPTADPGSYGATDISVPIILGANQAWDVDGGTYGNYLYVDYVSGSGSLTVNFSNAATLLMTELGTGALTLNGNGTLVSETYNNGDATLPVAGITMGDSTNLWVESPGDTSGPLAATGTGNQIRVATGATPEAALAVTGTIGLNANSSLGFDIDGSNANQVSNITASGNVTLGGATLFLQQAASDAMDSTCTDLSANTTYTVLSTSGSLTGPLNVADAQGDVVATLNSGDTSPAISIGTYDACSRAEDSAEATATVHLSSTAVTVTIASGGHVGDAPYESGSPTITGTPQVGVPLQADDTWNGNPAPTLAYTWYSCTTADPYCSTVVGGNTATYTPVASDQGNLIYYCVQATNEWGTPRPDCSDNTSPVAAAASTSGTHTTTTPTTTTPTTTTPTTTTPTTTTASSGPSAAQVSSALGGIGHPSGTKPITALIKQGTFATSFAAPSGGSLSVAWTTVVTTGKGKHKKHKTITVATGSGHASATGKLSVKIHLTAAGKALLKRKPHGVRVTDTEKFQPTGGSWTTIVKHFTL